MDLSSLLGILSYAVTVVAASSATWALVRRHYTKKLSAMSARHTQSQQTSTRLIQEAKRQIGQLHKDLASARAEAQHWRDQRPVAAQPAAVPTGASDAVRQSLAATLAEGESAHRAPRDGFADTLPILDFPSDTTFGLH